MPGEKRDTMVWMLGGLVAVVAELVGGAQWETKWYATVLCLAAVFFVVALGVTWRGGVRERVVACSGVLAALLVVLADWHAGWKGRARVWPLQLAVVSFLAQHSMPRVVRVVLYVTVLWVLVAAAETAFTFGIFDTTCANGVLEGVRQAVFGLLLLSRALPSKPSPSLDPELEHVAEAISEALSDFNLHLASSLIDSTSVLPEGLAKGFTKIVDNLHSYRAYLPDSCFPYLCNNVDGEGDSDSNGVLMSLNNSPAVDTIPPPVTKLSTFPSLKLVSLVAINLKGFLPIPDSSELMVIHHDLVNLVCSVVYSNLGITDRFLGDRVSASFNTARINPMHALSAVRSAVQLVDQWTVEYEEVHQRPLFIGLSTGKAYCGDLGGTDLKHYSIVGPVSNWVCVLERLATLMEVPVLCDHPVFVEVRHQVQCRLLHDMVLYKKVSGDNRNVDLYEVMEECQEQTLSLSSQGEWMYELETLENANPWTLYNQALVYARKANYTKACNLLRGYLDTEQPQPSEHNHFAALLEAVEEWQANPNSSPSFCMEVTEIGVKMLPGPSSDARPSTPKQIF
eukprot:Sspe_Gene.60699::Locus_33509_Transcript_1_1_Confidence_1.000_Length_1934::g.60699::m.60699